MFLMSNPSKSAGTPGDDADSCDRYSDRDLTWCLESMQGFCRAEGPILDHRDLSFALGTSPDHWLHLHFIMHSFVYESCGESTEDSWKGTGSGLRCERREMTVPIRPGQKVTYREARHWTAMRVGTNYCGKTPDASPSVVGAILSDWGLYQLDVKDQAWDDSGLQSPPSASGVALFQMSLWTSVQQWEKQWNYTLDHVDSLVEVKVR